MPKKKKINVETEIAPDDEFELTEEGVKEAKKIIEKINNGFEIDLDEAVLVLAHIKMFGVRNEKERYVVEYLAKNRGIWENLDE